ncbi:MAG: hypothetical protein AAGM67_18170, partial [Bacteroidota bacterium]
MNVLSLRVVNRIMREMNACPSNRGSDESCPDSSDDDDTTLSELLRSQNCAPVGLRPVEQAASSLEVASDAELLSFLTGDYEGLSSQTPNMNLAMKRPLDTTSEDSPEKSQQIVVKFSMKNVNSIVKGANARISEEKVCQPISPNTEEIDNQYSNDGRLSTKRMRFTTDNEEKDISGSDKHADP